METDSIPTEKKDLVETVKENWIWIAGAVAGLAILSFAFFDIAEEEPGEMIDVQGITIEEARSEIRGLEKNLNTTEIDATGDERNIIMESNWKVCSQSISAGEDIFDGDELEITYVRTEENCEGSSESPDEGESNGSEESSEAAETMPDVVGLTVAEARDTIDISYDINRNDITGEDRSVWNSDNWIVCDQSPNEGESITSEEAIEIVYDREDGGCASPDEWVNVVSESWSNPRDDIALEGMSADSVGSLDLHIGQSSLSDPEIASWAESNLAQMINLELPDDVAEVNNVSAYRDGNRLSSERTTDGLLVGEARVACDRYFESTYPGQDTDVSWIMSNRGYHITDNGTALQMAAGGSLNGTSVEVVCKVSGSNSDDATVLAFEVR